jgi:hypothetical protein
MRAAAVLLAVLAALVAAGASPAATGECSGLPACIDVPGPWVYVPGTGAATFLLDCPRRQGVVGGLDALASSRDIHVWWDAQLGGPVAPGRTTTRFELFHAVSGHQRPGFFQPRIGCIPSSSQSRQTTSARVVTPTGPPLDLAAATVPVSPGKQLRSTVACANHEHLVYSWDATAFGAASPPPAAFASAIEVSRTVKNGQVTIKVAVSEALPKTSKPIVQVGVACTK